MLRLKVWLKPMSGSRTIYINRAPVLTLWAAVVAERLGFRRDEALTLGRAVAGLNAYSKGVSLGLWPTIESRCSAPRCSRGPDARWAPRLKRWSTDFAHKCAAIFARQVRQTPYASTRCHAAPCAVGATETFGRQWLRLVRQISSGRPDRRQGLGCQRQPRSDRDSAPDQTKPITAVTVGAPRPVNSLTNVYLLASVHLRKNCQFSAPRCRSPPASAESTAVEAVNRRAC